MAKATDILRNGTLLRNGRNGQYSIFKHLASGGFGNTYLAHRKGDNYQVAIKEFFILDVNYRDEGSPIVKTHHGKENLFNSQLKKFRDEASRVAIMRNQHIVRLYDYFEENATAYYVMEFVDGQSLSERLKTTHQPLAESEATSYLMQVLDALSEVHGKRIWHLDIKPGNIMVTRQGVAKLIDFGASKQIDVAGNMTTTAPPYTPGYAPVEQVEGEMSKFGPWTDFYALGATFYNLLTNQKAPTSSDIIERGVAAFHFPQNLSARMKNVIYWMMRYNLKDRPQSVAHIMQWWNSNAPQQQRPVQQGPASQRPVPQRPGPQRPSQGGKVPYAQPKKKKGFGRLSEWYDDLMDVLD